LLSQLLKFCLKSGVSAPSRTQVTLVQEGYPLVCINSYNDSRHGLERDIKEMRLHDSIPLRS
jgi:hypothetical protein